ncbi:hypothetical protein ES703_53232 [subsurface metagenome]
MVKDEIDGSGFIIPVENFLPGLSSIPTPEHAPLFVGTVHMTESRHIDAIRISGMDANSGDLTRIFQSDMLPGFPRIRGFVHAIAMGNIAPDRRLTHAHINDIRVIL